MFVAGSTSVYSLRAVTGRPTELREPPTLPLPATRVRATLYADVPAKRVAEQVEVEVHLAEAGQVLLRDGVALTAINDRPVIAELVDAIAVDRELVAKGFKVRGVEAGRRSLGDFEAFTESDHLPEIGDPEASFFERGVDRLDVLLAPSLIAVEVELLPGAAEAERERVGELPGEVQATNAKFVAHLRVEIADG